MRILETVSLVACSVALFFAVEAVFADPTPWRVVFAVALAVSWYVNCRHVADDVWGRPE